MMKAGSMRILGAVVLVTTVALMGIGNVCYGQPYEPEHIWHRCGEESGDWFGKYIAGIGDVNNDGYGDFLAYDRPSQYPHIKLFHGGNPPDTTADLIFHNPYPYGYFGYHLENVGDVNNDSYDDFAVQWGAVEDSVYRVLIYWGGVLLDTIPDVALSEGVLGDIFGYNIEGVGDVNGDGYDDVAVQASGYNNNRGKVWIYFGGSSMDSIADWEREGVGQNTGFGRSIAGKGDLNGDDFDDIAIYEAIGYPNPAETTYYIYFGNTVFDTIPDVVICGEVYYPEIDISNSSALIGNLNGDSYADLVISAGRTTNAVVFYGGDPMDTEIDLVLEGFDPVPQNYGMDISLVGDVNWDGFGDIIASQSGGDVGGSIVLVFLGSPWMDGQPDMRWMCWGTPIWGCGSTLIDGGDINGDGVDDIIFGSYDFWYNHTEGCIDIWLGDTSFVFSVPEENLVPIPKTYKLLPPYPNPFNSQLTIPIDLVTGLTEDVSLKIYNILGQEVINLSREVQKKAEVIPLNRCNIVWNGKDKHGMDLGTGVYLVELRVGLDSQVEKVVLLR
jgi:hypothetical protein